MTYAGLIQPVSYTHLQLKGIRCPSTIRQSGMKCTSCPDAIAKAIERVYQQQVRLGHWAEPELSAAEGPAASQAETVVPEARCV